MAATTIPRTKNRLDTHGTGWSTKRPRGKSRDGRTATWLLLPTGVLLATIIAYPMGWALFQSLQSDSIGGSRKFIGLANYAAALWGPQSGQFWNSVGTTFLFTIVPGALELVIGIAMALLMNNVVRGRTFVRVVILIPWAIPTAVAAVLWRWMLQPTGIINTLAGLNVIWTAGSVAPKVAIMMIDVWKTSPFIALLVLAGLQIIPTEVHEAARVDGASWWQRFRLITLPLVKPAILVALLFRLLDLLRMYDVPAILTNGANNTTTLSLFTFQNAIQQVKYGYGSALSTLTFLIVFLVALLLIKGLGAQVMAPAKER